MHRAFLLIAAFCTGLAAQQPAARPTPADPAKFLTQPIISEIYTADPAAHVFDGKIYVYPSHDFEAGVPQDDLGSHFAMRDYHVLSMDAVGGKVTDHGVALDIKDVPWAGRQMWAPDAAEKGGKYFLYFPVKDKQDVFRIGAAVSDKPAGPFKAEAQAVEGSYSMDPAVFKDTDGKYYMYFGGIWGGQLQRWATGTYVAKDAYPPDDQPALTPKIAAMRADMLGFSEKPRDVVILDEQGKPLTAGDNKRRFFEASWMHKYRGQVLLLVLDGRHAFHRLCDRRFALRSVHLSRQDPGAGAGLDQPSLDRRVQGQVVPLLPRHAALGRADPSAQRQSRRAEVSRRRHDRDDRRVSRLGHGAPTSPIGQSRTHGSHGSDRSRMVRMGTDQKGFANPIPLPVQFPRCPRNP